MPRYAILDVDDTLLYNMNDINEPFLNSLVANGITDVILFTKMSLRDITKKEAGNHTSRIDLIEHMNKLGLNIHFVSTPQDCAYGNSIAGEYFEMVYKPHYQEIAAANFKLNKASQFDIDLPMSMVSLDQAEAISRGKLMSDVKVPICESISDVANSIVDIDKYIADGVRRTLLPTRYVDISIETAGKGYKTVKGFMAELLLSRLSGQSNQPLELFVVDDDNNCLLDFEEAAKRAMNISGHQITVTTFNIPKNWGNAKEYNYDREIEFFKESIRLRNEIVNQLHNAFKTISKGWFWENKDKAKDIIIEHIMHYGDTNQWLALADMAENDTGFYHKQKSLIDAYHLLVIAILRAQSSSTYIDAQIKLEQFMERHHVHQFLQDMPKKIIIAQMKPASDLTQKLPQENYQMTAKDVLHFMKTHALRQINKDSQSQMLRHRLVSSYSKRQDALNLIGTAEENQDKVAHSLIAQELRTTTSSMNKFREVYQHVAENPLAWGKNQLDLSTDAHTASSSSTANSNAASSSSLTGSMYSGAFFAAPEEETNALSCEAASSISTANSSAASSSSLTGSMYSGTFFGALEDEEKTEALKQATFTLLQTR